jgi:hypothetical protein
MTDLLEAEIQRGQKAAQILAEPLLIEALSALRKECFDKWQSSPARDAEGREKLFLMLKAADRVQAHLVSIIENGQMAEATLTQRLGQRIGMASVAF